MPAFCRATFMPPSKSPRHPGGTSGMTSGLRPASLAGKTMVLLPGQTYVGTLESTYGLYSITNMLVKGGPLCYGPAPSRRSHSVHSYSRLSRLVSSVPARPEWNQTGRPLSVCDAATSGTVPLHATRIFIKSSLTCNTTERIHTLRSVIECNDYRFIGGAYTLWDYATQISPLVQMQQTYNPGRITMMVTESLVRKLESFIGQIRMLDDGMPLQQLACFLAVARREGQSIAEIATIVGIAPSSASRNVSALDAWTWKKTPGLSLVTTREDPMELRKKQVVLTPKGRRLLEQIESIFEGGENR